tara:strand:+ start:2033 stop:3130 length:1098 start_codon:yes stop_codon:yes gene_type:complete
MANYFIAAGGTGGHIYPGLALAESLKKSDPQACIYFVGTPHGLENQIVGKAGYPLLHLKIGRLNRNVSRLERIKTLLQLPFSFVSALRWILKYRPKAVIGVGGHASGPMLLMSSFVGTPSVIWEPNAMPGLANRWLARHVDLSCIVFDEAKNYMRGREFQNVGLPLRSEIEALAKQPVQVSDASSKLKVLIFGGSQGARGINRVVSESLEADRDFLKDFEIWHQTGRADFEDLKSKYEVAGLWGKIQVMPYIEDMVQAYRWADVVVCRAGTGTLAELAALGKPSILIPLPTAADNHQQKNAEAFLREHAAQMILQKDLTPQSFKETLRELRAHPEVREKLGQNARKLFQPKAADKMAEAVLNLSS